MTLIQATDIEMRPASIEDAGSVARIHVAAWRAAYQGIIPTVHLEGLSVEKREAYWRDAIARGELGLDVARTTTENVGWVASGLCRAPDASPDDGEIWAIYVAPGHWSQGIGQALLRHARSRLARQGFRTVRLWVLEENRHAIRFYLAAGLVPDPGDGKKIVRAGKTLREVRYSAPMAG